ncbi:MAG: methylated-DNA--[protein]-cysteine S-methyltransferase, partial [Burkholderiales bacterium]|nr:methylated-DNA--[protein]-cysteine S-methyltransferase [Burkholderiales bacterium]
MGSTLGWLLVAARDNGVCMIEFGDTRRVLRAGLCSRFPKGLLEAGDGMLHGWVQCVIDYLRVPEGSLNLPLDVQGTAFQKRVWNVLQSVPAGQTLTYAQVAQKVGNPNAVRAVARAVASNRVAIVIPCHRVIGTD